MLNHTQRRCFSVASRFLFKNEIRPAVTPRDLKKGDVKTFERNFPIDQDDQKPWDKRNMSKDDFFRRKYANISDEYREKLNEKVARQRRMREMRSHQEYEERQEIRERAREERRRHQKPYSRYATAFNPLFEYVFGTHAVKSVLQANKRVCNALYVYNCKDSELIKLAKEKHGIRVIEAEDKNELNVLSKNGVHNGVVLETKGLDLPVISSVGESENGEYKLNIHSDEDNSIIEVIKPVTRPVVEDPTKTLHPLALFLDEIQDPQNMGNIVRTAYFLGVDFIVVPNHSSAKLGGVANKASAGALDMMDIYQTSNTLKFVTDVRAKGWHVISTSGTPDSIEDKNLQRKNNTTYQELKGKFIELSDLRMILNKTPVMLVIGSEGEGVRTNIKLRSDYLVGIPKGREGDAIVDSLNVVVATGIAIANCI
ncbi:uncharacterized protein J8A68_000517 [[Candida] subhashii]|uniref:rRNA methyltransferase 1, mitochondrial n=1 Tax=[Candida] subhashii TaxID=561895 RepID=A0A8J5QHR4_9ASCO|nr:uncharacterized protein J8A68_000517 [[Candida] subhashii]KAG7665894.1 hypothetical protein J8A68_000517 [[Candida] subhashii]